MPEADFDYSKSVKYVEFGVYRFSFTRKWKPLIFGCRK